MTHVFFIFFERALNDTCINILTCLTIIYTLSVISHFIIIIIIFISSKVLKTRGLSVPSTRQREVLRVVDCREPNKKKDDENNSVQQKISPPFSSIGKKK